MSQSKTNAAIPDLPITAFTGSGDDASLIALMQSIPATMGFDLSKMAGMGMKDSNKYRAQLFALCKKNNITLTSLFSIVAASVAVKNKDRIIEGLEPFKANATIAVVINFYRKHTEQYVPMCNAANQKFPVVKIPESLPNIALVAFLLINCSGKLLSDGDLLAMITHNLWFPQLNVSADLKGMQMVWERDVFWGQTESTGLVQKSKFNSRASGTPKLLFHPDFWNTKAADAYPLLMTDGTNWPMELGFNFYRDVDVIAYAREIMGMIMNA